MSCARSVHGFVLRFARIPAVGWKFSGESTSIATRCHIDTAAPQLAGKTEYLPIFLMLTPAHQNGRLNNFSSQLRRSNDRGSLSHLLRHFLPIQTIWTPGIDAATKQEDHPEPHLHHRQCNKRDRDTQLPQSAGTFKPLIRYPAVGWKKPAVARKSTRSRKEILPHFSGNAARSGLALTPQWVGNFTAVGWK
jgi:hypothetical protein